jgi:hypothetical protein
MFNTQGLRVDSQRLLFEMTRLENKSKLGDYFKANMRVTGKWEPLQRGIDCLCLEIDKSKPKPQKQKGKKASAMQIQVKSLTGKIIPINMSSDQT